MEDHLTLSPEERKEWKRRILKRYLRNFLVSPFPREQQESLAKLFRENTSFVTAMITPDELTMRRTVACYLLSFGKELDWTAVSTHELVKLLLEEKGATQAFTSPEALIIYHGFDAMPNKLHEKSVEQTVFLRSMAKKRTLICLRASDPLLPYPVAVVESATTIVRSKAGVPKVKGSNPPSGSVPTGAVL